MYLVQFGVAIAIVNEAGPRFENTRSERVVLKHKKSQLTQNWIINQSPKITNSLYFIGIIFNFLLIFLSYCVFLIKFYTHLLYYISHAVNFRTTYVWLVPIFNATSRYSVDIYEQKHLQRCSVCSWPDMNLLN